MPCPGWPDVPCGDAPARHWIHQAIQAAATAGCPAPLIAGLHCLLDRGSGCTGTCLDLCAALHRALAALGQTPPDCDGAWAALHRVCPECFPPSLLSAPPPAAPAASAVAATVPVAPKPPARKPVAKKPTPKKIAPKKPAPKKPAPKKPAPKKQAPKKALRKPARKSAKKSAKKSKPAPKPKKPAKRAAHKPAKRAPRKRR